MIGFVSADQSISGEEFTSGSKSKDVTVSLTVSEHFTVTIPDSFSFSSMESSHMGRVSADITTLGYGKNLTVYIQSTSYEEGDDKKWYLTHTSPNVDETIMYGIKLDDNQNGTNHIEGADDPELLAQGSSVLSINKSSDPNDKTQIIHFKPLITDKPSHTGRYEDRITFTVETTDGVVSPTYLN